MAKIAVTGSSGLIGRELVKQLATQHELVEIDIEVNATAHDIGNADIVEKLTTDCSGIIHLAAVSRVAEAQEFPLRT